LDALFPGEKSRGDEKKVEDDAERAPDREKALGQPAVETYPFCRGPEKEAAHPFGMDEAVSAANEHTEGENGTDGIAKQGVQDGLSSSRIEYADTIGR
jgi:hypothetical protein